MNKKVLLSDGIPDHDGYIDHLARGCTGEEINAYRTSKHILKASQLFLSGRVHDSRVLGPY